MTRSSKPVTSLAWIVRPLACLLSPHSLLIFYLGYPYFQGSSINTASTTFWNSIIATRNAVNAVSPGKWVWVTETGWPVSGKAFGAAKAGVANAQTYWNQVACQAFKQVHIFWYVESDYWESPSFGMFDKNGKALYDLATC